MKKHLPPVVAILRLSSCTTVDDFGAYWDKGFVDPALEGTWKKIGLPGVKLDSTPGSDKLVFVKDGRSYSVQAINPIDDTLAPDVAAVRKKDNDMQFDVRTLEIGHHLFVMSRGRDGQRDGVIERYEVEGDILREYRLNNGAALDFIQMKHPTARNIGKSSGGGTSVAIKTFDDEVFQILSEISDAKRYWDLSCQYKKGS